MNPGTTATALPQYGLRPDNPYRAFKRVMTLGIILNVAIGIWLLAAPEHFVELLQLPVDPTHVWNRYAGMLLIILTGTYGSLVMFPHANTYMAAYAILLRFAFVVFFLIIGSGFYVFAIYDVIFGVLIAATYWRGFRTDLMAKP